MEILYIILGWLFGLLASPITSRIGRVYKSKDYKFAINSELKNFATRLASTYYRIKIHYGELDRPSFKWVGEIYKKHNDNLVTPEMEKIFEAPDVEFEQIVEKFKGAESRTLNLKTFHLPVMDSLLGDISVFDTKFQRKVLEIRSQTDILNQQIENSSNYFFLTFDPNAMSVNKHILNKNIEENHKQIYDRCKIIVDKIDELILETTIS